MISKVAQAWGLALKKRKNVRVALIDPDDGSSILLNPEAGVIIYAALTALAEMENSDPMAVFNTLAKAAGVAAPGNNTIQ